MLIKLQKNIDHMIHIHKQHTHIHLLFMYAGNIFSPLLIISVASSSLSNSSVPCFPFVSSEKKKTQIKFTDQLNICVWTCLHAYTHAKLLTNFSNGANLKTLIKYKQTCSPGIYCSQPNCILQDHSPSIKTTYLLMLAFWSYASVFKHFFFKVNSAYQLSVLTPISWKPHLWCSNNINVTIPSASWQRTVLNDFITNRAKVRYNARRVRGWQ